MEVISIPVEPEIAEAFDQSSAEEREKLQFLVRLWSQGVLRRPKRSLEEIMDDIGAQAAANGMTPEILASILADDSEDE